MNPSISQSRGLQTQCAVAHLTSIYSALPAGTRTYIHWASLTMARKC